MKQLFNIELTEEGDHLKVKRKRIVNLKSIDAFKNTLDTFSGKCMELVCNIFSFSNQFKIDIKLLNLRVRDFKVIYASLLKKIIWESHLKIINNYEDISSSIFH